MIRGEFNPTGKLPLTIPASQEEVVNEKGDVPVFDEAIPMYTVQNPGTVILKIKRVRG